METSVFTADTELVEMAKEACLRLSIQRFSVLFGRVVTGDQFISDNGTKAALVKGTMDIVQRWKVHLWHRLQHSIDSICYYSCDFR